MAKQVSVKTNSSLKKKLNLLGDSRDEFLEKALMEIANYAVNSSPVDTGAYVLSHSILPYGANGGRMRSSDNKPPNQNIEATRQHALGQLQSDINSLDFDGLEGITLRNRSRHARDVEDKWGYGVYRKIRDAF
jgi:hypothetical protein